MPHTLHSLTACNYLVKQETLGKNCVWVNSYDRRGGFIPDSNIKTNTITGNILVQLGLLGNSARTFFTLVNAKLQATAKMTLEDRLVLNVLCSNKVECARSSRQQQSVVPWTLNHIA